MAAYTCPGLDDDHPPVSAWATHEAPCALPPWPHDEMPEVFVQAVLKLTNLQCLKLEGYGSSSGDAGEHPN